MEEDRQRPQEIVIRLVVEQPGNEPAKALRAAPEPTPRTRTFRVGEAIFKVDDTARSFFVIESGSVRMFRLNDKGMETVTTFLERGDVVGTSAFTQDVHTYNAVAMDDVAAREYDVQDLRLTGLNEEIIKSLARKLGQIIIDKSRSSGSLLTKLATALLDLAEKHGERHGDGVLIKQKITHEMLAGVIGGRRETVTIHLGTLKDNKAVESRSTGLFVRPTALRSILEEAGGD